MKNECKSRNAGDIAIIRVVIMRLAKILLECIFAPWELEFQITFLKHKEDGADTVQYRDALLFEAIGLCNDRHGRK